MMCECSNCKTIFQATGTNVLLVLSGGMDCPECKTKDGINLVVITDSIKINPLNLTEEEKKGKNK